MPENKTLSISEFLLSHRDGGAVEDLADKVREVTNAVRATGKAGAVTLKIKIKPNKSTVFISDDITATVPKAAPEETLFFVTDEGALSRRDPYQPAMAELERVEDEPEVALEKIK